MSDQDSMDDDHGQDITHALEEAQELVDHNHEDNHEPTTEGVDNHQEAEPDQEHETVDEHLPDDMYQDSDGDPETVLGTTEQELDVEVADYAEEPREYDQTAMDGTWTEPEAVHTAPIEGEPVGGEPTQDEYAEDETSLFVPENTPPARSSPLRQASFTDMAPPAHPTPPPPPPPTASSQSVFARIRSMQRMNAERRNAAKNQANAPRYTVEPDNEAYLEAVMAPITPSASTPVPIVDEDDMANRNAEAEYRKHKRHYDELRQKNGRLTFMQDVQWMKIHGTEKARRQKRERDLRYARMETEVEPDLFPEAFVQAAGDNDDRNGDLDDAINLDNSSRKRRREMPKKMSKPLSMQDAELQSMRVALEASDDLPKKKKPKGDASDQTSNAGPSAKGKGSKAKANKTPRSKAPKKPAASGEKRTAKARREIDNAVKQATSLFTSNVFTQQASTSAAEQPVWNNPTRNKQNALKELIASVPLEDKKQAKSDMNGLIAATKEFNGRGSVKPAGGGNQNNQQLNGWIVKGMKTSLKNYQVLGTAFMRRRENALEEPKGGLMADQMGLGKTLMMLANIVNGRPPPGQHPKTTLLVASPALLTQWKQEIQQHTDCGFKIMKYSAGTRIDSSVAEKVLQEHDIVLTTYGEVMKSYPKNEPPIYCQTAEQKIEWWKDVYESSRGILHRMMFLRVVLDEAQAIKNHLGRTSIACRALMAHHKWALSGTPILNSLTELYPYFKFLGVPHTGSFKIFKYNYCDTGDAENTERLLVRLSQFMIRRTHADEMFGAPILKLPQADQSTFECEFNSVERMIYDIVRARFATRINVWAQKGDLDKSYSNALVMLLRLRQLTAHVLMLHFVMRDLLEREDIERIQEVVNSVSADSNTCNGQTIIAVRKALDKNAADEKKKSAAKAAAKAAGRVYEEEHESSADEAAHEDQEEMPEPELPVPEGAALGGPGGDFGKEYNFKPYLRNLRSGEAWEKIKKKARCGYCNKQPREPWMTSCGHLICGMPCMEESNLEAAEQEKSYAPCKSCGTTPTYIHPLQANEDDFFEPVAQGTRSKASKQKEKQRKRREQEDIGEDWLASLGDNVLPSAKTIAVKAQIMNWRRENSEVKIIVYTQFLAMIRILARVCQNEGWRAEQYHGKMSFSARDKAIDAFAQDPSKSILLASLRCGGLGLNLTMASKVIMIDPWWNSASEQQAFCRVFRIGQSEQTYMSRLCVKNTIDQRLMEMQERKQKEIDGVMENDGSWKSKMGIRDLMRLFGNLDEDSEGSPFIMVDNPDPRGGFRADRDDEGYADEF